MVCLKSVPGGGGGPCWLGDNTCQQYGFDRSCFKLYTAHLLISLFKLSHTLYLYTFSGSVGEMRSCKLSLKSDVLNTCYPLAFL